MAKNNINKPKGPSREKQARIAKRSYRTQTNAKPAVVASSSFSRKKDKARKKRQGYVLMSNGMIQREVTMKEDLQLSEPIQRVMLNIPPEILEAAASGPGTTLGIPQ